MSNKSSIEWLIDQLEKWELYSKISFQCLKEIEQAKEMHKQEIKQAYESGSENSEYDQFEDCYELKPNFEYWYEETFGK